MQLTQHVDLAERLLDASIDLIFAFDTSGKVIAWNQMSVTIFGITKEEAMGKDFHTLFPSIKDFPKIESAIASALKGLKTFVPSDKGSFQGGFYENHFIPLRSDNGELLGVMNLGHDVAHRVKAERQLMQLNKSLALKNKELNQRNEELSSFSQVTSSDLKEPLRKIRFFAEALSKEETGQFSEKGKYLLDRMQINIRQMDLLTDDILSFSQLNRADDHFGRVNLNLVLKTALRSLEEFSQASEAEIVSASLPSVHGYRNLLTLLFHDIIENALKFQPPGNKPHLTISFNEVKGSDIHPNEMVANATYAKISFADNGIGFDEKHAERMFLMFQRLYNAVPYPGRGLGLTICKKIMELHNGFVQAEGRPGEGAVFHCYFPMDSFG